VSARVLAIAVVAAGTALAAPASAQVSERAADAAREQGFDARRVLGDDVSVTRTDRGEALFRVGLRRGESLTVHGPDTAAEVARDHGTSIGPGDPERPPACASHYRQHVLYGVPAVRRAVSPSGCPRSGRSCGA